MRDTVQDPAPTGQLVPVTVVLGPEELLVERAVAEVVSAARVVDPESDVREIATGQLRPGTLGDAVSPSLFGERKVVVVRGVQDLAPEFLDELSAYVRDPVPAVSLVCVERGSGKAGPKSTGK